VIVPGLVPCHDADMVVFCYPNCYVKWYLVLLIHATTVLTERLPYVTASAEMVMP
jgi:hypothetical protein